jgi:NitT/TauT family transport system permease protein
MKDIGTVTPMYGISGFTAGDSGKSTAGAELSFSKRVMSWYGIIAFLFIWQLAPYVGLVDGRFIPPLSEIIKDAFKLATSGEIFLHIASSLQRVLSGLFLALAVAIPGAIFMAGFFPRLTRFLNPLLILFGNINPFALFPLFILLFGVGEVAKLAIIFWSSIFPVLNFTIHGVTHVDNQLIKAAQGMGAGKNEIFWKVLIPAAMPSIFTGCKMGATTAFLFLIAAEMLAANSGLGYLVHNASLNYYIPRIYVGVLGIAILGMGFTELINRLEKAVLGYRDEARLN